MNYVPHYFSRIDNYGYEVKGEVKPSKDDRVDDLTLDQLRNRVRSMHSQLCPDVGHYMHWDNIS